MSAAEEEFDRIIIDKWPIVFFDLHRTPHTDEEIDRFEARFSAIMNLAIHGSPRVPKGRLYMMMNLDGVLNATMHQQLKAATFISNVRELAKQGIRASALIIRDETVRLIFEIIVKIQPLQTRHEIFTNERDGEAWLEKLQAEEGMTASMV